MSNAIQSALRIARDYGGSTTTTTPGGLSASAPEVPKPKQLHHSGPINSTVAGRTDHLPMTVRSGSYVAPADVVSHSGGGNTIAGFKVLQRVFAGNPYAGTDEPYGGVGLPYDSGPHPYDQKSKLPYGAHASGGVVKHAAAGILFVSPSGKVLLMRRTGKDHQGEYALPAGGIEKGETAQEAAKRETKEEAGHSHTGHLKPFMHSLRDGVDFTTFTAATHEFTPRLNDEHDDAVWADPKEALEKLPLHPGVKRALEKFRSKRASGGKTDGVPIVAAGGELVFRPEDAVWAGDGDIDRGHRILDKFMLAIRKDHIKTLQNLDPPRRD